MVYKLNHLISGGAHPVPLNAKAVQIQWSSQFKEQDAQSHVAVPRISGRFHARPLQNPKKHQPNNEHFVLGTNWEDVWSQMSV